MGSHMLKSVVDTLQMLNLHRVHFESSRKFGISTKNVELNEKKKTFGLLTTQIRANLSSGRILEYSCKKNIIVFFRVNNQLF